MTAYEKAIHSKLMRHYKSVDAIKDFDNWFDTIYAFEKLPFIDMNPSEVLWVMDLNGYNKLLEAWVSEKDLVFMFGRYWNKSDVEEVEKILLEFNW